MVGAAKKYLLLGFLLAPQAVAVFIVGAVWEVTYHVLVKLGVLEPGLGFLAIVGGTVLGAMLLLKRLIEVGKLKKIKKSDGKL